MNSLDIFVQKYFSLIRTPLITEWMIVLTGFFDISWKVVVVMFCIAVLVYLVRGYTYALLFAFSIICSSLAVYALKFFFDRARPTDMVISAFGKSFPSYHATLATVFFVILMYIFDNYLTRVWRVLFNLFCFMSICLISFSRVYLGVHWMSDVLAGIALGAILSYISIRTHIKINS